ncbi:MAG TPA: hypothetical protein VLC09_01115 [Polyangiaceae bacterium]|nr:hypothetical protein [Polyangiaceae bacterium]
MRIDQLNKQRSASFEPRTKNHHVWVEGDFTVESGRVAVVALSCFENPRVDVVPGKKAHLACQTTSRTSTTSVTIDVFAMGGEAKNLRGELVFSPR